MAGLCCLLRVPGEARGEAVSLVPVMHVLADCVDRGSHRDLEKFVSILGENYFVCLCFIVKPKSESKLSPKRGLRTKG